MIDVEGQNTVDEMMKGLSREEEKKGEMEVDKCIEKERWREKKKRWSGAVGKFHI